MAASAVDVARRAAGSPVGFAVRGACSFPSHGNWRVHLACLRHVCYVARPMLRSRFEVVEHHSSLSGKSIFHSLSFVSNTFSIARSIFTFVKLRFGWRHHNDVSHENDLQRKCTKCSIPSLSVKTRWRSNAPVDLQTWGDVGDGSGVGTAISVGDEGATGLSSSASRSQSISMKTTGKQMVPTHGGNIFFSLRLEHAHCYG